VARGFVSAARNGGSLLNLRVSPGAANTAFAGMYGDSALKVRVVAPPEDGRANVAVTGFLAESLGVARSDLEVVRGGASRDKVVRGADVAPETVEARIRRVMNAE